MSEKERRELALNHVRERLEVEYSIFTHNEQAKEERRLYREEMQAKRQRESVVYTSMMTDVGVVSK